MKEHFSQKDAVKVEKDRQEREPLKLPIEIRTGLANAENLVVANKTIRELRKHKASINPRTTVHRISSTRIIVQPCVNS